MEAGALLTSLAKAVSPSAQSFLKTLGKKKYDEFIAKYTNIFSDHIRATTERCSTIKTLLHRDEPVPIDEQYVKLYFSNSADISYEDHDILDFLLRNSGSTLISGLAGCGKSMFMKWATLRLIEKIPNTQIIPLFIEIREISPEQLSLKLDEIIFKKSSSELSEANFNQFRIGLMEGQFFIIVDGLDEVPVKYRDVVLGEIVDFKRRFPKAPLLCSSRPDMALESSNSMRVMHVKEMTVDQISMVIGNARFDPAKKSSFIKALNDDLYQSHTSFLSNPLLAIIMLITFDVSNGVPSKLSLFYSQVYEALFYKHDSSKGIYTREHYSNLDIDQFESIFRTFSFQSYALSRVVFQATELLELIKTSILQSNVSTDAKDFILDCKKSLCLMQEDGIYTSFVHRSFQEYFAAKYLSYYGGPQYPNLVDAVIKKGFSDNTFSMLCQINAQDVLRRWCLPKIDSLISNLSDENLADENVIVDFMKKFATSMYFDLQDGSSLGFSFTYDREIRLIYAINQIMNECSLDQSLNWFEASAFKGASYQDVPEAFSRHFVPEENDEDDDQENEESLYRWKFDLSDLEANFVFETGLPDFLRELRKSLKSSRQAVKSRIDSADSFADRVREMFNQQE